MNIWDCIAPRCTSSAVGVGGAAGLQAVGWYYRIGTGGNGPEIRCPAHHPEGIHAAENNAHAYQEKLETAS